MIKRAPLFLVGVLLAIALALPPVSGQIRAGLIDLATQVTGTLPTANGGYAYSLLATPPPSTALGSVGLPFDTGWISGQLNVGDDLNLPGGTINTDTGLDVISILIDDSTVMGTSNRATTGDSGALLYADAYGNGNTGTVRIVLETHIGDTNDANFQIQLAGNSANNTPNTTFMFPGAGLFTGASAYSFNAAVTATDHVWSGTKTANFVLAGPTTGAAAVPAFRALVAADIPNLSGTYLTSVTAHNVLSATHGDTLADSVVRGDILYGNSTPKWARLAKPSVLSGLSHDGTDVSWVTATGTGAPVRATSPTLVTPLLGTPTSVTLTNGTGLPEAGLSLTDITTNDVSATKHGFAPKFPNNTTTFLRGDGTYAAPTGSGVTSIATTSPISGGTITTTGTLSLLVNVDHAFTASQSITKTVGVTSADGLVLTNTTAAAAGAQQWSPRLHLTSQGWKTDATAASQTTDWIIENQSVQGAANPTTNLVLSSQLNAAGYTARLTLKSDGSINVPTGTATIAGPAIAMGTGGNFLYGTNNGVLFGYGGVAYVNVGASGNGIIIGQANSWLGFISGTPDSNNPDVRLVRGGAAATLQMGQDVNGAAVNQTFTCASGITGTDKTGCTFTFSSGKGTGAATPSQILLQTPTALASGTTAQTNTTRVTIDVNGLKATGYLSSDGTAGLTASCASTTTLTVKNGLITACS